VGKYRKLKQRRTWAWWLVVPVVKPTLLATTKPEWIDGDKIPEEGGCILVLNHVTQLDPLTAAHLVWDYGRMPHYLAKAGLFKNKALAKFLRSAGQIPVERASTNALGAFQAAVEEVRNGQLVVVYPEGSVTKDPDLWPMVGKSGAARIALETGCPVIPVGQWGAHELLPAYGKPNLKGGRKPVKMKVGDPVDLSDLLGKDITSENVRIATDRIMTAIVHLVEEVRGGTAPVARFDPVKAGIAATGNPNAKPKKK